jgi:hypothetical protein
MGTENTLVETVSRAMVRTVVGCLTGLALGAVVFGFAIGPGLWHDVALGGQEIGRTADQDGAQPAVAVEMSREARLHQQVARMSKRLECSRTGFGGETIPSSALVQVGGHVSAVSFDEGWAIRNGERPGRLLAVCRH